MDRTGAVGRVMAPRRRNTLVIGADNTAEYTCACGAAHALDVDSELLRSSTPVRMRFRCPCGRRRVFFLERRAAVRKEVNLPGVVGADRGRGSRAITIRNLSRTGALFELGGDDELAVGDRVVLEFELEHAQTTRFRKRAVVRRVSGLEVGAEFVGRQVDRVYDMALALHRPQTAPPG